MGDYNIAFLRGYMCAVASLVSSHGTGTQAEELVKGFGKVAWDQIDEYDRSILVKAGLAPRTRSRNKRQ